jgi:DNA-binding protein YbaB
MEPLLDPGMALDRIAAWQQDVDQLVTRTRAMSDRLGALRVTAGDARRVVELTIDTHGALLDIRFSPRAVQQDPDTLARTVMATLRDARRQAGEQTRRIILESVGTESPAAREILTQVAAKLSPSEAPPEPGPSGPVQP